ncbi:MAG: nitrogen regulation protein NR(I) [Neomegalonema sp.]|nr:nitrogen regulation protein NR(I) [Neomegalonema sp.]
MNSGIVLLADDDKAIRTVLSQALTRAGHRVRSTGSASILWQWIEAGEGDIVLSDVMMPDGDGIELLPNIKRKRPDLPVIVMSAQNTVMTAIRAAQAGAYEYLPKPFDLREVISTVERALATGQSGTASAEQPDGEAEALPLIGRSAAMQDVYRVIARLTPTDLTVMVSGESGTGKELVARALHDFGRRKQGPFVAVNMAAIPKELIESELFGHEKGAFTGATQRGQGKFELAQGGTLFLDEIGDMPLEAQTRLLRVLQEGEFVTVGGREPIKTNVRIIAATHQDLRRLIKAGLFREDLFYRLNVVPLTLPPLRERYDDIPDLARYFLRRAADEGLPQKGISRDALEALKAHNWPGNVRELENLIRRLAVLSPEDTIDADTVEAEFAQSPVMAMPVVDEQESMTQAIERHLKKMFANYEPGTPTPGLYDRVLRELEHPLITLTLHACRGNQVKAAEVLGINRNTLRKKIRELDIPVTRGKNVVY